MKKWFKALVISFIAATTLTLLAASVSAANVGSWAGATSMGTPRQGASATLLPDGKVLVAGGETAGTAYLNTTEIYTPTGAGTWAAGANPMGTQRAYHSARVLPNGKTMVIGGYNGGALATTEIYDPATTLWTPGPSMSTARYKFATAVLLNGKIMAVGGYDATNTVLKSTEIYDPTTNTWSAGPNLNTAREGLTASTLMDGRILVVGGNNGTTTQNTAEIYSPSINAWSTLGTTMTVARENARTVELNDGTILIAGGYDGAAILTSTEIYKASTNTFTADAAITQASGRRYAAITELQDGKVLLAGGSNGGYLASTEIGTFPATNEQTTTPVLTDIGNAGNATDMMVMFKGAPNEAYIKEYRIIVEQGAETTVANGADAASLNGTANVYVVEPIKGANRMHLVKLPASLLRASGGANTIDTAQNGSANSQFKVYVLAKGKQGFGNTISPVSTTVQFGVAAMGNVVSLQNQAPVLVDLSNTNHDARDLKVTFKRPADESNIQDYRIILIPSTAGAKYDPTNPGHFTLADAQGLAAAKYFVVSKVAPSSTAKSYSVTNLPSSPTLVDYSGGNIVEGTAYRVYVWVRGIKNTGADDVLLAASKPITLSPYVPGVYAVRAITLAKTGAGFTSDLIKVTFSEPTSVTGIQDYRIFLVTSTASLTQALADTNATVANNCYVYTPTSPAPTRLTSRSVQLGAGVKAYDGTAFNTLVTKGVYKVYVLSYNGAAIGNKLSASSIGKVTLD